MDEFELHYCNIGSWTKLNYHIHIFVIVIASKCDKGFLLYSWQLSAPPPPSAGHWCAGLWPRTVARY